MKRLLFLLLLVASPLFGEQAEQKHGPNEAQLLKLYGHLPSVAIEDAENAAVDEELCDEVLEGRFCMHPDFPDAHIAESDPEILAEMFNLPKITCERFISLHQKMLEAVGSGS